MDGITIGGATVRLSGATGAGPWSVDRLHRPFCHLGGSPTLALSVSPLSAFRAGKGDRCYDSGLNWRVFETPGMFSILFSTQRRSRPLALYRALSVDRRWRAGTLYLPALRTGAAPRPFPLDYPLEPFLFVSVLARSSGAVVHGTGVIREGRGFVFAGTHGAGKSTLAALFRRHRGIRLLNDDRVVLRHLDGQWRLFGTPWAGTVTQVSADSAPLGGVFFLRHDSCTRAIPLSPLQATPRLLARCFQPYWDREGVEALLVAIGRLARAAPCYEFPFVPRLEPVLEALGSLQ